MDSILDDIFCIFKTHQNTENFLMRINKWHPNMKLTVEFEGNEKLQISPDSIP